MITINICKDFSDTPGARYTSDGNFSGEEFREKILKPKFEEALERNKKLKIEMDGGYGYPTSFLEEAFGGLAREFGAFKVKNLLEFVSEDEPSLVEEILSYIDSTK